MMNITMSSFEAQSSEEEMNTQLGGGMKTMQLGEEMKTMQLGDLTVMAQGEKGLSGAEWIIRGIEMSRMMLGVIWYKTEWIVPGCIGKTKLAIRWPQAPSASARESGQPQFHLISE